MGKRRKREKKHKEGKQTLVGVITESKESNTSLWTWESKVFRRENLKWVILLSIMAISLYFLYKEHIKVSANFWYVLLGSFVFSGCIAVLIKILKFRHNKLFELGIFLALFSILVSGVSDVLTQSDTQKWEIIKRIYDKESSVDLSEIQNPQKPQIVITLDMSASMKLIKLNDLEKKEQELLTKIINEKLTRMNIPESDRKKFFDKLERDDRRNSLYSLSQLKLLEFVSHTQIENTIHCIICFGLEPIRVKYFEHDGNISLKDVFYAINEVEDNQPAIKERTDFIKLFDEIMEHYKKQEISNNEMPKYSFAFFSDYILEADDYYLLSDLENRIIDFCSNSHFSSFYYHHFDSESRKEYMQKNKKTIDIFPVLKKILKKENGLFIPITDSEINLFNISSNTTIPVYYEYSYSDKLYGIKITFDSISIANDKYKIALENNTENEINYHHQFKMDGKNFPLRNKELTKPHPIILTFSGRIINQFPCYSLVFCSENKGCCRFDIVFFKDFPWYVRYIVTAFVIMGMVAGWLRFLKITYDSAINKITKILN
jgi:hypothetical protein